MKREFIDLVHNDAEVVYELSRVLDLDMIESDIDELRKDQEILKAKVKSIKRNINKKIN